MSNPKNRRPLKARSWAIMQKSAQWISKKNITPNQISIASIAFSGIAGLLFLLFPVADSALWFYVLLILLCFIGRAFCNILDGLVAVEGGKATASGELFNDIPDRISDVLIIVGAGYATGMPTLGWLAAVLAVMTAYVRTLGRGLGAPTDFQGPMAKLQRMLLISVACFLAPIEAIFWEQSYILALSLIIISIGCVITIWKRAKSAYDHLEGKSNA
ncbi:MAG: CDP-diacylglycerol--glycerol-3-phosphate 3-phosphatidyltransferase [Alphaproteobacteria bacterium]|nr:MAG: CDP-diacylglycerol--glycerol-3-phosphate 3-phosphatidyltransferase [Alphaproteobacteria bacterium]